MKFVFEHGPRGLQVAFIKPDGARFVVRWADFNAAMTFGGDFYAALHAAWPLETAREERRADADGFMRTLLENVRAVAVARPVPCLKGHLHADATRARACEEDPCVSPMVRVDFTGSKAN